MQISLEQLKNGKKFKQNSFFNVRNLFGLKINN